jgi:hypothetical protein
MSYHSGGGESSGAGSRPRKATGKPSRTECVGVRASEQGPGFGKRFCGLTHHSRGPLTITLTCSGSAATAAWRLGGP